MDNRLRPIYTYADAGFNGFMSRSIDSTPAISLRQTASDFRKLNNQTINFDHQQTSGSMGDSFQVGGGGIVLDGKNRRISIYDENHTNEVGRIGNLDG